MPSEHVVAQVGEISAGERRIVSIGNLEIGVFNVAGQYYALPNVCLHQYGPVCTGRISGTLKATAAGDWKLEWVSEGQIVTCPWHGLEYNITTGQCLAFPRRKLRSYPVKVEDGQIKVLL
jgi:nitrite reductase/ring-hydroxylating ferredoxin subunit